MRKKYRTLSYLITVSREHLLPAQMLLLTLKKRTKNPITVVGNLLPAEIKIIEKHGVKYIDEDSIDYKGRLPKVDWNEKYRKFGWYKQMFIRLSIDTFMKSDEVVILDSEVFALSNWNERKFYDPKTGRPRSFYWIPQERKPEWDYRMYRGAAYLLSFLPECRGIMDYANSDNYKRHISGVVLFSTENVAELWRKLERTTDLHDNIDALFNRENELAFSDHDFYGLAAEYGLFEKKVPVSMHSNLYGWYGTHDDARFNQFKQTAMWSMCQKYYEYITPEAYNQFMTRTAEELNKKLPDFNLTDVHLLNKVTYGTDGNQEKALKRHGMTTNIMKRFIKYGKI